MENLYQKSDLKIAKAKVASEEDNAINWYES